MKTWNLLMAVQDRIEGPRSCWHPSTSPIEAQRPLTIQEHV